MKCSCGERCEPTRYKEASAAGPESLTWKCKVCGTEWKTQIVYSQHQIQTAWVRSSTSKDGICPVCDGSTILPSGRYCQNCGGQTMYGEPTGRVPLRPDGSPCKHDFEFKELGPCLSEYTCRHCGFKYQIDSGD